ncbi:hypothetical protein A176_000628 [Myxococcus hansupus]|uniref:Uncharacterized protein n=1 Tax=Pseudomyxococcus hansupus TaxID=1297742 RepID=A0A0H4WK33_9BACT|nr:hypothetical protein A176_000628 [Myxococcus hansupus]
MAGNPGIIGARQCLRGGTRSVWDRLLWNPACHEGHDQR